MKKYVSAVIAGSVFIGLSYLVLTTLIPADTNTSKEGNQSPQVVTATFEYQGKAGSSALEILKTKTPIEQNNSGLVISINNTKANPSNREYWAFYVNGEMAQVGPQDYQTKDTDQIEWRLETF